MRFLISTSQTENINKIKGELAPLARRLGALTFDVQSIEKASRNLGKSGDIWIWDTTDINDQVISQCNHIRELAPNAPIVLLANVPTGFTSIRPLHKSIRLIGKPYHKDHFVNTVWQQLEDDGACRRKHKRYNVDLEATAESYNSDFKGKIHIKDISRGGAQAVAFDPGLKNKDVLKVSVYFDKLKKDRILNAQVVWLEDLKNDEFGIGLEFVSQKALFSRMLEGGLG